MTRVGAVFYPLVIESLGLWSPQSLEILKIIARREALQSNISISQSVCNFHERTDEQTDRDIHV